MEIVHTVEQYRSVRCALAGESIGFVPTMGALHAGHAALIERSVADCDFTVVSVYVNPTQFDNPDDLRKYPETLEKDARIASALGAQLMFAPDYEEMYPDGYRYQVRETAFSNELCGAHREGHFAGVLTVVMKLLNIIKPHRAYFGEKDFQQYVLVRDMARTFFMDVDIVSCPTVREEDGLALSSRNLNLDCESRKSAPLIYRLISSAASDDEVAQELKRAGFDVDYVVSKYGRRFAAARIGKGPGQVRLIDNVPLAGASE